VGDGDGESAQRSMLDSELVGELATDEDTLESSDSMDSSLILVCSGRSTLTGRTVLCSAPLISSCFIKVLVAIVPVDFEYGDSSMGVTLTRDEGESKDSDLIRTFGDGVRGGTMIAAISKQSKVQGYEQQQKTCKKGRGEYFFMGMYR